MPASNINNFHRTNLMSSIDLMNLSEKLNHTPHEEVLRLCLTPRDEICRMLFAVREIPVTFPVPHRRLKLKTRNE